MKKIFIVSRAKNESDIIESFCRYNLSYCDGMIINDNKSDDNTLEILLKLMNEGLPIHLTQEASQLKKAKIAIDEYGAELVVPLDADEFLYNIDGINPREALEELNDDIEYQIPWRTYVYEKEPDIKLGFITNNFKYYRNSALEKAQGHAGTTLITKYLIKEKKAKFTTGIHWLEYPDEYKGSVKIINPSKLVCAHFPIRSQMQVRKKAVPNWITKWASSNRPSHDTLDIFQLGVLFNDMRDMGEVAPNKMKQYAIEYSVRNGISNLSEKDLEKLKIKLGDNLLIKEPLDVSFCNKKLKLRYTDFKDDNKAFLRSELKEIDKTVIFLDKESKERSSQIQEKIKQLDEINQSLTKSGTLFFDTGNGFNDNEKQFFSFNNCDIEIECQIPENTKNIRLDIVIGYGCVVYDIEILSLGGIIDYKPVNGFMDKLGNLFYKNSDPQIYIYDAIGFLKIKYKILVLTEMFHHKFVNDFINTCQNQDKLEFERNNLITERDNLITEQDNLISEKNDLIKERRNLTTERNNLITERDNLTTEKNTLAIERDNLTLERNNLIAERNNLTLEKNNLILEKDGILNSRSWRFTKSLRDIAKFIRKYKVLHLFAKGLLSIKRIGILKTIKRILNYICKKPEDKNSNQIINNQTIDKYIPSIKIKRKVPRHTESVDIIICVHNAYEDVKRCIESVYEYTSEPYRIILVDDGSAEQTRDYLSSLREDSLNITLIRNENGSGYTRAANQGLKLSDAEYCVLLNSDTIVTDGWLDKMINCQKSDKNIGIVGPLSNTASWQSVPRLFNDSGDWAKNELPEDIDIERFAELIDSSSEQVYPKLPLLNGFCLMIHRSVINKIGYFDEENFGSGFAEEDDYNLRAGNAGFKLALADDTYIYHAQSKSYTDEKRIILCNENGIKLRKKHGNKLLDNSVYLIRYNYVMEGIRARVQIMTEREEIIKKAKEKWEGKRVLFLLPIADSGGGGNVIIQEARCMMEMGVDVWLYNLDKLKMYFEDNHPNLDIPVIYGEDINSFLEYIKDFDIVCSTLYSTVKYCDFKSLGINTIAAYYIQDFEPYFFKQGEADYKEAFNSYTSQKNIKLITKTEWNRSIVEENTGAKAIIIGKSLDIDMYRPRKMFTNKDKIIIATMIRPNSPRRAPELTLKIMNDTANKYKNKVTIYTFGSNPDDSNIDKNFWNVNYMTPKIINLGKLSKIEIVSLLSYTDIFADFSSFQAMGLTAMEAMACGCGVIVPKNGGSTEFVSDGKNGIVVDTSDKEECMRALSELIENKEYLNRISYQALKDACEYYPEKCAYNFLDACFND